MAPCDGKESNAGDGYLKSYRVMLEYSRNGMDALFDQELPGF